MIAATADRELHYGGRSRRSMAFLDALGAGVTLYPQDEVGLIDLDRVLGRRRQREHSPLHRRPRRQPEQQLVRAVGRCLHGGDARQLAAERR